MVGLLEIQRPWMWIDGLALVVIGLLLMSIARRRIQRREEMLAKEELLAEEEFQ